MRLVKVTNEEQYIDGEKYLGKFLLGNLHALSCYAGFSHANTSLMLNYDIFNIVKMASLDERDIKRIIAYSQDGEVVGVATSVWMEDFSDYLDYEQYMVIMADSYDCFREIFRLICNRKVRYEIITFREQEYKYALQIGKVTDVHYWYIYRIDGKCNREINIRRADKNDVFGLDFSKIRIENNPCRYLEFVESGIQGYNVYVYREKSRVIAFISVIPYTSDCCELKIGFMNEEYSDKIREIALFFENVMYVERENYKYGIVRVKISNCLELLVVEYGKYNKISTEKHVHGK